MYLFSAFVFEIFESNSINVCVDIGVEKLFEVMMERVKIVDGACRIFGGLIEGDDVLLPVVGLLIEEYDGKSGGDEAGRQNLD